MATGPKREVCAVLAFYTALTLVFTYPIVLHFNDRILGDGDAWLFTWNMWWMRAALLSFDNPFCTDYIHYPTGVCAYLHTWNFPVTLASIPLQSLFSLVTLYNLSALLSFVLAAYGMLRLAKYLGAGSSGAILAGIAFSFSPYHFAHAMGHLNLISYQWIPFFIHSFLSGIHDSWTGKKILIASGWLVLVGLTDWYYLVFCLFAAVVLVIAQPASVWLRTAWGGLKVVLLSGVVLSPLVVAMVGQAAAGIPQEQASKFFSADLQSFFLPGPISTFSTWFERRNSKWTGLPAELGTFVPWSVLLLAIWGWRATERRHRTWLTVWIVLFFVLSLGPVLHVSGAVYESVTLPYSWIEKLPGLQIMRAPIRFHLMTYLGICLLYGAACQAFVGGARRTAFWKGGLLALVVLTETLSLPLLTAAKDISPFYRKLKISHSTNAVIDLHYNSRALYYQSIHGKKIMGNYGMLSRQPSHALNFLRQTPVIKELVSENQVRFFTNGWPEDVLVKATTNVPQNYTLIIIGKLLIPGELLVKTSKSHQLWIDEQLVSKKNCVETRISLRNKAVNHVLKLRTWGSRSEKTRPGAQILLDGQELSARTAEPFAEIPPSKWEGLTLLFYPQEPVHIDSKSAVAQLKEIGFNWIVLPFYGNDHFIRESLKLTPSYQDQWLEAYELR